MDNRRFLGMGGVCALGVLAAAVPLRADWVNLESGKHLRGVEFEKRGNAYRFTLETGEVIYLAPESVYYVERSSPGETVKFRGREVSLREKVRTLQKERQARAARMIRLTETWSRGGKAAAEAKKEISALPPGERCAFLAQALKRSTSGAARTLAARELASQDGLSKEEKRRAAFALARAAVRDKRRSVRRASISSLERTEHPDTALFFLPALRSAHSGERIRAANALVRFPDRRAANELLSTLYLAWTGFGRGYMMQGTQRAYVADYDLVSGGTGFSIVEVADPIVRTATTGVVLDVDVQRVEMWTRLKALEKITGKNFGLDVQRWREWLAANPAK